MEGACTWYCLDIPVISVPSDLVIPHPEETSKEVAASFNGWLFVEGRFTAVLEEVGSCCNNNSSCGNSGCCMTFHYRTFPIRGALAMSGTKIIPLQCGVEINQGAGNVSERTLALILSGTSIRPLDDVADVQASCLPQVCYSNVHKMVHSMVVVFPITGDEYQRLCDCLRAHWTPVV